MTDAEPVDAPTTRAERARRTRARIVEAALHLFADKGYDATSLQDIAAATGLTKPAVHYHYRGKQEILKELVQPVRQATAELMARARALPLGPERVDLVVNCLTDLVTAGSHIVRIVAQQPGMRTDLHAAVDIHRALDDLVEALFGLEPTLDQRFAVYSGAAIGQAVWALGDVSEDALRGVVERALRRTASVH